MAPNFFSVLDSEIMQLTMAAGDRPLISALLTSLAFFPPRRPSPSKLTGGKKRRFAGDPTLFHIGRKTGTYEACLATSVPAQFYLFTIAYTPTGQCDGKAKVKNV